jgi:hypothetical protein
VAPPVTTTPKTTAPPAQTTPKTTTSQAQTTPVTPTPAPASPGGPTGGTDAPAG